MKKVFLVAAITMTALFFVALMLGGFHLVSFIQAPNGFDFKCAGLMIMGALVAFGGMMAADQGLHATGRAA